MSIPLVVFDCMIYAQAMMSRRGPAAGCVDLVRAHELQLVWSDYVLREIRELPDKIPPRLKLTSECVEAFISDVAPYAMHLAQIADAYENPFDRDDSHYVNLALASGAQLVTSRDRDLLRLMDENLIQGREFRQRFPDLKIITPVTLLELLRQDRINRPGQ